MRSSCKCSLKPIHWCKHGNRSQEYSTVMVVQRENDQLTRNDRKFGDVMSKNRNRADSSLGYFWGFTIIQHGIRYSGVMWGLLQPPIFGIETCRLPICWRRWTILFCGCNHFQAWSKWNMFQGPCKTSLTQCWTTRPSLKFVTWTNWTCSRHSAPQVTFVQSPNALWAVDVSQRTSETNPSQIPTVSMGAWKCTSPWKHICWWEKPRTKTAGQRSKWTWVGLKMRYLPVPNFPIRFWQFGGSFLHFLDIQMNVATLHATCCDSKRVSTKRNQLRIHWKKTDPFWNQRSELTCCCLPIPLHLIIWSVIVGYMMLYAILSRWKISSISQHSSTSHHSSVPYGIYI